MIAEAFNEKTPDGIGRHEPGAKLDAGKPKVGLMMAGFPDALMAVAEVATKGADKYTEFGWHEVKDGHKRYSDALGRHFLKAISSIYRNEAINDPDLGVNELACIAWNALALLQLSIENERRKQ